MYKNYLFFILFAGLLMACGEEGTSEQKAVAPSVSTVTEEVATQLQSETAEPKANKASDEMTEAVTYLPSQVVYQEEIYKNWPYTEAPAVETESVVLAVEEKAEAMVEAVKQEVEVMSEAVSSDKPYQLVDGVISANAIEGWKTYNGGGCGACHGKGGIGAVGPNLADSVVNKLSKEEFVDIVANGKPGTMMRPHKTNKRVMDNMDALYAYLVARGDDVLGPGNLIKLPLGK